MRMFKKVQGILVLRCAVKMFLIKVIFIFVAFNCGIVTSTGTTGLVKENENHLLLLSTLDGFFVCVEGKTGVVRWKIKEEPVIRLPKKLDKPVSPYFLPDPKDGSLYMLNMGDRETLSKLPFTIPQLVASSPCRTADGVIFTGKKLDTWFTVNPENGAKRSFLSYNSIDLTCPREGPDIYIGRTEYNIVMVDPARKEKAFNVTFYDYLSYTMDSESKNNYNLLHFTGSSSGRIITLDRDTGSLIWQLDCDSPVVDIYILEPRGLLKVPFTSVAEPTLDQLIDGGHQRKESEFQIGFKTSELKFFPTLYIGECMSGWYALPALVDENTATIVPARRGPLLLDGPTYSESDGKGFQWGKEGDRGRGETDSKADFEIKDFNLIFPKNSGDDLAPEEGAVILLGHYKVPQNVKSVLQIEGRSNVRKMIENESSVFESKSVQTEDENSLRKVRLYDVFAEFAAGNVSTLKLKEIVFLTSNIIKYFVVEQENLGIKTAMVALVITVFSMAWYFNKQMKDIQQLSQSSRSRGDRDTSAGGITALPEETDFGLVRVGKIEFNADEILGKGCEGTFVFKGKFDNRSVAVKRVLPECFTFANREVELLRESDHHPNVIRYYCMEQDKQFRYIALELCAATLQDYIEGKFQTESITSIQILQQAMCGLKHLHQLSIVHRDIKPHNVLLSMPTPDKEIRVMISDFGLCKKLKFGRTSFSRRSGVTGTEGWIAPEMLGGETRTTCAVDVFSMGCVFYYVLTGGRHPFGDALHRQANILSGNYDLSHLEEDLMASHLVRHMIDFEPLSRPTANAILQYPMFWTRKRTLTFFQDVSDRIEKEDANTVLLKKLEENGMSVVRGDWRYQIDSEVAVDLRKFRNYHGDRVRDLLRALRNKKHHYRELPEDAQKILGTVPDEFMRYWLVRFPLLLVHTWITMQCVKYESVLGSYFDKAYNFRGLTREEYGEVYWVQEANLNDMDGGEGLRGKSTADPANWRIREEKKWRNELKCSDVENGALDFRNAWFRKWRESDFEDDEAFFKWREDEFAWVTSHQKPGEGDQEPVRFDPEPPTWELKEKFRILVAESPKLFEVRIGQSPRKNKPRRFMHRKFNRRQEDNEKSTWPMMS